MFLAAVARPRFDSFGNGIFVGKIGIWPILEQKPAQRNNKYRKAGTLETKPIDPINQKVSMCFMINKVIPAIRAKWPTGNTRTIYIQQDNAKPHIGKHDKEFKEAASIDGFNMQLICQPPNSPDMNTLDLEFFVGIQSLQHRVAPEDIDELISAVESAFNNMSARTLNRVFLSHQLCMREVLKCRGGIDYDLQHIGKQSLDRNGKLPLQIAVEKHLIHDVLVERNMLSEFWSSLGSGVLSSSENPM
ncbi:uncharacterized protein LOC113351600 [Papaver somniferum]|uniref:uncharacterized protein LOC113351600 n=1 Tax=Papaver somniferum TaxID=3469 RepID=UPI000E6F6BA5|nr:uncharacterized protein LOC113351600 [Papaver somniferum]